MLYLVRHADALDAEIDELRPLSPHGCAQIATLAKFLGRSSAFAPEEIWHSPLVRARETAQLLVQHLRLKTPLAQVPDLRPEDEPAITVRRLKKVRRPVAIVGHEPHLSALATLLVVGSSDLPSFVVKKCSVLALEPAGEHWMVRWFVSPDIVG